MTSSRPTGILKARRLHSVGSVERVVRLWRSPLPTWLVLGLLRVGGWRLERWPDDEDAPSASYPDRQEVHPMPRPDEPGQSEDAHDAPGKSEDAPGQQPEAIAKPVDPAEPTVTPLPADPIRTAEGEGEGEGEGE